MEVPKVHLTPEEETKFQGWYKGYSDRLGLNPDPDDPKQFYDYRAAFRVGAEPDKEGHWPSYFKQPGHPRLIVDGIDTRTGRPAMSEGEDISGQYAGERGDADFTETLKTLEERYGQEKEDDLGAAQAPQATPKEQGPGFFERQAKGTVRGLKAMGHGLLRGTQAFWSFMDDSATLASKATGWEKGDLFKRLVEMAAPPEDWTPQDLSEKIVSGFTAAAPAIATISALPGSAPVTMGYMGAITGGAKDGWKGALSEGGKGILLGNILHAAGALRPELRIPIMGGVFGTQAAAEGGGPEDITEAAVVGGGLGIMGPGRPTRLAPLTRAEANPLQGKKVAFGRETDIVHTEGKQVAQYAVMELSDLQPSHMASEGFRKNPNYPDKVQERLYDQARDEQLKVIRNAQTYNPDYTVNTDPTLVNGPPAITPTGTVLGGNSRIMSLDLVYGENPQAAARYREALEIEAPNFGIDPAELAGFEKPVLVRVIGETEGRSADPARMARLFNQPPTHGVEQRAEGVSKSRLVSQTSLNSLVNNLEEFGTLREFLNSGRSRDFIQDLAADGVLDKAQVNKLISEDTGLFTEEGKHLVENVIRGRVFEDAEFLRAIPPGALQKLDLSLPALIRIKTRGDRWDIVPQLKEALIQYGAMKSRGYETPADMLAQGSLFGGDTATDPKTRALLDLLNNSKPTEIKAALNDYAMAAASDVPNQATFAFYTPETPEQAFSRLFGPEEQAKPEVPGVEEAPPGYEVSGVKEIRVSGKEARKLEDKQFEGRRPARDYDEPQHLILTGGLPGAGKSTAIRRAGILKDRFVLADADQIKVDAGLEDRAAEFHEQSSEINEAVSRRAINEGYNLIYDSLLSNFQKADTMIQEMLRRDGKTTVMFVNIDPVTSITRAKLRVAKGESERKIPAEAILKGYNRSLPTFLALLDKYAGDPRVDFDLWDNNVDGQPPVQVFVQSNGEHHRLDSGLLDSYKKERYIAIEGGNRYEREKPFTIRALDRRKGEINARFGREYQKWLENSPHARSPQRLAEEPQRPGSLSPYQKIKDEYPDDPKAAEEQLNLFHKQLQQDIFRDLTDPANLEATALAGNIPAGPPSGVKTTALAINTELINTGRVDLRGKTVRNTTDLAKLAQVFRDPRMETLRFFYVKNGRIVAQEGVTSRMPDYVAPFIEDGSLERFVYQMKRRMGRLGADGYYMLHNHPSGNVMGSNADARLTEMLANRVPGFKAHLIIDGGEYMVMRARRSKSMAAAFFNKEFSVVGEKRKLPGLPSDYEDPLLKASIPNNVLDALMYSPEDVAKIGSEILYSEKYVPIIYRDAFGRVRAIQDAPIKLINQPKSAAEWIRGQKRRFGAQFAAVYDPYGPEGKVRLDTTAAEELIQGNILQDVVRNMGNSVRSALLFRGAPLKDAEIQAKKNTRPKWFAEQAAPYEVTRSAESPEAESSRLQRNLFDRMGYGKPLAEVFREADTEPAEWLKGPADTLPERAVNILLRNASTSEDVQFALAKTGELFLSGINAARRGTITNDETLQYAEQNGMTVKELLKRRKGRAFNAEEITGARILQNQTADELVKAARKIGQGNATDREKLEFRKLVSLHYAVQAQVSGAIAEAGRTLQSLRMLAGQGATDLKEMTRILDSMGGAETVETMAEQINAFETKLQLNKYVNESQRARTSDVLFEIWINWGLLSAPVTHVVNTLSNMSVALMSIPERFLAAEIGRVLPGEREITENEAVNLAMGIAEGSKAGLRLAWQTLKTEQPSDLLGKIEARKQQAISAEALGLSGPIGRGVDLLGQGIRIPGRALMTSDEFFKAVGYQMELNAQAVRQARAEGLTGQAFGERVQELISSPPKFIRMAAIDAARYATFTQPLEGLGENVAKAAYKQPLLKIIVPFVRTPVNVMKYAFERTPLAPFSAAIRADVLAGGARRDLALARMGLGTMLMVAAGTFAASGYITGAGPIDPEIKKHLYETGWQPNSVYIPNWIPGGGKYIAYSRIDPWSSTIGLAADVVEIMGQLDSHDAEELAAAAVMSVARNVTNKTYMRGVSEFFQVMSDPERYGERYIRNLLGTAVPALSAHIARMEDPVLRDVRSVLDQFRARIPGYSKDLPPRRNLWGEPVYLSPGLGPDIISPFYTSDKKSSPVDEEILRLGVKIGMPSRSINGIPLTPKEYSRFVELAGNAAKNPYSGLGCKATLAEMIRRDPLYRNMPDGPEGGKATMIKETIEDFRDLARNIMFRESPELKNLMNEVTAWQAKQQTPAY